MDTAVIKRSATRAALVTLLVFGYLGYAGYLSPKAADKAGDQDSGYRLVGDNINPTLSFTNPYPQIPAQCYIETGAGTQNACLFCHTNGVWAQQMGNNNPQAGAFAEAGNFQLEYAFVPYSANAPLASINRWENTLHPEKLADYVRTLGISPEQWDMQAYLREDNWQTAYQQRPAKNTAWDSGTDSPFRLLPALDPQDLPAKADGFVRSSDASKGFFHDAQGHHTGWRAINFMPYGIFTPQTGSVSGIYIRLPVIFMQNDQGQFDLGVYQHNLELLAKAVQNRLTSTDDKHYAGKAKHLAVKKGVYPVGTEFAHPLHYVDMDADGTQPQVSRFPGTRSQRVKEVRYMIKWEDYDPMMHRPTAGAEGEVIYGNDQQGWVDNGAGWYLVGFIEDAKGQLRPQSREELTQCIGCHSGVKETQFPTFTSGSGNTVDSTWAFPRQLPNALGWQEMNYLGYVKGQATTSLSEPHNRGAGIGEYRLFLNHVVGASLYGEMPAAIERVLATAIRTERGYTRDWVVIDTSTAQAYRDSQRQRQALMREFTAKAAYRDAQGRILADLFYPPKADALAGAARYRQVVVSQRFAQGKDVFVQTPITFRALRPSSDPVRDANNQAYAFGDIIESRSVDRDNPASETFHIGNQQTEIDPKGDNYLPDYVPFIQ